MTPSKKIWARAVSVRRAGRRSTRPLHPHRAAAAITFCTFPAIRAVPFNHWIQISPTLNFHQISYWSLWLEIHFFCMIQVTYRQFFSQTKCPPLINCWYVYMFLLVGLYYCLMLANRQMFLFSITILSLALLIFVSGIVFFFLKLRSVNLC